MKAVICLLLALFATGCAVEREYPVDTGNKVKLKDLNTNGVVIKVYRGSGLCDVLYKDDIGEIHEISVNWRFLEKVD